MAEGYRPFCTEEIRKSATECVEILSEAFETQRLVENILKSNTQASPPLDQPTLTQRTEPPKPLPTSCNAPPQNFSPNTVECHLPSRKENAIPQRWESPLTQGVRTVSPDEYTFKQIPSKCSTSALASALAIAPSEPFNPVHSGALEPVPLPDETEPYFPPEHPEEEPEKNREDKKEPSRPDSQFVSALKIAPERPFSPVGGVSSAAQAPVKKKIKDPTDKYFEDLPKPQEKVNMRTALTTASERPYTPLIADCVGGDYEQQKDNVDRSQLNKPLKPDVLPTSFQMNKKEPKPPSYYSPAVLYQRTQEETVSEETSQQQSESKETRRIEKQIIQPAQTAQQLVVEESSQQAPPNQLLPIFQGFSCSFQNKTDYSNFSVEISTTPPVPTPPPKPHTPITYIAMVEQRPSTITTETVMEESKASQQTSKSKLVKQEVKEEVLKQAEEVVQVKPLPLSANLHRPEGLPQYQVNLQETATAELLLAERREKAQQRLEQQKAERLRQGACNQQNAQQQQQATVSQQRQEQSTYQHQGQVHQEQKPMAQPPLTKPTITVQPGDLPPLSCLSVNVDCGPCSAPPRPVTPSRINKPASTLPYYQANLVAQHFAAPSVNVLDPRSPAISRSPSPCPFKAEEERSASPFPCAAREARAKSPAQGPPTNPLQWQKPLPTPQDSRVELAKQSLTAFIPEYKSKREAQGIDTCLRTNKDTSLIYSTETKSLPVQQQMNEYRSEAYATQNLQQQEKSYQQQSLEMQDSQRAQVYASQTPQGSLETSIQEKSRQAHLEASKQSETQSTEQSGNGRVQIQKRKTVTEEYERTQKEKTIQIETNVTGCKKYPFRDVRPPVVEGPAVQGLHVTNPQPISSPFKVLDDEQTCCKKNMSSQDAACCQKQRTCDQACRRNSNPKITPDPSIKNVFAPSSLAPAKHVSFTGSSSIPAQSAPSQNVSVPNVPNNPVGAAGGRQSGGISVAPKRGRGVLNTAAIGGARVPLCGQCHQQIRGPFVTALGKIWCPQHFTCGTPSCRRPLQDLGFVEEKGQLYCEYCFEQYLAPPCSKCSGKIKGDCLKAIGRNFHPECFNCVYCGKLFGNCPFFLEDGEPYCDADWNQLFTTKCFACGFPVEAGDRWVEALNNNYHSQCFNCTMCKKNLEGQSFFAKGGRPFCKNHAR